MTPSPSFRVALTLIGLTQIVAIGSIIWSFGLLAPSIAAEFGVTVPTLFGTLSIGMFLGGLCAPLLGRWIDRVGGLQVMTIGSGVGAFMFSLLATAPSLPVYMASLVALQVSAAFIVFGAAVPSLAQLGGRAAVRSIAVLNAMAALSSSIFFPLVGFLEPMLGWRGVYWVMATLHGCIALPIHVVLWRSHPYTPRKPQATEAEPTPDLDAGVTPTSMRLIAFWAVAVSLALSSSLLQGVALQLVPVLSGLGLGGWALAVGMILGPAQIVIRVIQAAFFGNANPLSVGLVSSVALPISILLLFVGLPPVVAGIAFVALYGLGQGLNGVVNGTLPLHLFGHLGYGETMGRMAMVRVFATAPAPFVFSYIWDNFGLDTALRIFLAVGIIAILPLGLLARKLLPSKTAGLG